jgi:ectoine hydroxylase-related dioxygenase (phytanoyl-CoA dioxygenase family)
MTHSLKADCVGHDVLTVAKESYETEGYCIVDNAYPPTELDVMDTFFEDFKTQGHKAFGDHIGTDDGLADNHTVGNNIDPSKELLRAIHPHHFSPQVKQWYLHPRIAQVLTFLLERPALAAQTMYYYYKPPQSVGQGMHQDNFFLLSKPATCIATWTPLDDTDQENGCLKIVQGSHREEILCPPTKGDKKNSILDMVREPNIIPICMKRGQTLFFSGQLIHGSEPNYSHTRSRRTFIGHYVDNMTENIAKFYHPVLDMQGQVVSHVAIDQNGGPCQEVK